MTDTAARGAEIGIAGPGPAHPWTRWVHRGLDIAELALDAAVDGPARAHLDAHQTSLAKITAETAILVRVARACGAQDVVVHAERVAARLRPLVTDPHIRLGAIMRPAAALDVAAAYLVLREEGADPALDAALHSALAARSAHATERLPHRELEQEWLAAQLDGRPPVPELVFATVLAAHLDVLCGSRDDAYAFTHALMYATDFGRHPDAVPASLVPRLLAQAQAALAGALDDEDWDLAGELLLTWPMLAADAGPAESTALAVLLDLADAVGTLPSATLAATPLDGLAPRDRGDAIVLAGYHTAYVLAILAASLPRCSWQGADGSSTRLRDTWFVDDAGRPGWLDLPTAARAGSGEDAAGLISAARRRRHVRARRFADLAADVSVHPSDGESAAQSLELLERLARAAGF
ncbi:MAG: DUF6895 family protein [Microbacterium sp.]|uniref:DUF6895 family protein n=1 Tax=Microbacterium sp. TaxID=51671 RepID=UPI003F7F7537